MSPHTIDLHSLPFTLTALRDAYAQGLTPVAVVNEVYRRLAIIDDPGIFLYQPDRQETLDTAQRLEPTRRTDPLWGIPFVIKDNIDVAGWPTTAGCPAYRYTPGHTAPVVERLCEAGALLIGKTNLDQFATGLVGVRTPYPVPRNAIDQRLVPGGSSSGSAVAVAHGAVCFSLGTDTAGSGRVPAALNNIVGLKPSLGALSSRGVVPACRTLDTVSIFALTVHDASAVFDTVCAFDPDDPFSEALELDRPEAVPAGLQVGIPAAHPGAFTADALQVDSFHRSLGLLRQMGIEPVPIDFTPLFDIAQLLYDGAWVAERLSVLDTLLQDSPEAVLPVTRQIIGSARSLTAVDAFRGQYRLKALLRQTGHLLADIDLLCVPSIPTFVSVADTLDDPTGPNTMLGSYTNFVNLMRWCAVTVPGTPRTDGLPGSITLLARAGADGLIAAIARTLHVRAANTLGATNWPTDPAEATPVVPGNDGAASPNGLDSTPAGCLSICVCGAHMHGLALNHQLTELGARIMGATHTAPCYRLYALPGNPPQRPGLCRVADADGHSIAVEVWALPMSNVGRFLDGIPAPLALGRIRLQDGTDVCGFTVEAFGTVGARDISRFGGWRSWLQSAPPA